MIRYNTILACACGAASLITAGRASAQQNFDFGRDLVVPFLQGMEDANRNQNQNVPRQQYNNRNGNNTYRPNGAFGGNDYYYDDHDHYHPRPSSRRPSYTNDSYEPRPKKKVALAETPKKNVAPKVWAKATTNKLHLVARSITAAEIQAANAMFDARQMELLDVLKTAMEKLFVSPGAIISELSKHDVPAEIQTQIIQAVKAGKAEQAQILWASATKDIARAEEIYEQVNLRASLNEWQRKAAAGTLTALDLKQAESVLTSADVEPSTLESVNAALAQLDTVIKLRAAINTAIPGKASKSTPIPTGLVAVIHNPKMPVGTVITLGNGYCMCGTGGAGELEIHNEYVAFGMGMPLDEGECVGSYDKPLVSTGTVLANPEENSETIHYTINGKSYEMAPGLSQTISSGGDRKVSFDRGGRHGRKTYKLSDATYHFVATEDGWDLKAKKFTAVIDNSENPNSFNYSINNKPYTVGANDTKSHTSKYPMVVQYDRGNGDETKKAKLEEGAYRVAINGEDNLWDIYPPEEELASGFTPAF